MDKRKLGNIMQIADIRRGKLEGIELLICKNGKLNLTLVIDNALDIFDLAYAGENMSFITKNGLKRQQECENFDARFPAGFIFTCGLDNIGRSDIVLTHGNLCMHRAEIITTEVMEENGEAVLNIIGKVCVSKLFGEDICITRHYKIYNNKVVLTDTLQNNAYKSFEYMLLYHVNFGYPMLDGGAEVYSGAKKLVTIAEPVDNALESCTLFDATDSTHSMKVINKKLKKQVEMKYDTKNLKHFAIWESYISGDYALGLEPMTTRFDNKQNLTIEAQSKISNTLEFYFSEI